MLSEKELFGFTNERRRGVILSHHGQVPCGNAIDQVFFDMNITLVLQLQSGDVTQQYEFART